MPFRETAPVLDRKFAVVVQLIQNVFKNVFVTSYSSRFAVIGYQNGYKLIQKLHTSRFRDRPF